MEEQRGERLANILANILSGLAGLPAEAGNGSRIYSHYSTAKDGGKWQPRHAGGRPVSDGGMLHSLKNVGALASVRVEQRVPVANAGDAGA